MQIIKTIGEARAAMNSVRKRQARIGYVPTMGNLHEGHLSLVRRARQECDAVIVSIFVNPLQFGEGEDFATYPRSLREDGDSLAAEGVTWIFVPDEVTMYPEGRDKISFVDVPELDCVLEGESRPGHFRGVATVVTKLFNIIQPDVAYFGEKDFQQLLVIRRLVRDLNLPVEVVGLPTLREPDGLAMSSRNQYLSTNERQRASELFQTLTVVREKIKAGERDFDQLAAEAVSHLQEQGFAVDYVTIRCCVDLSRPETQDGELVILAAARLGKTRLIDNLRV